MLTIIGKKLKKKALLRLVEGRISSCLAKEALQEELEGGSSRPVRVSARRDHEESAAAGQRRRIRMSIR